MTQLQDLHAAAEAAIMVDEVGVAYGVLGEYRLKTLVQPVFRLRDDTLTMIGVDVTGGAHRAGKPVDIEVMSGRPDGLPPLAYEVWHRLHLRNHGNIGESAVDIHLKLPASGSADLLSLHAGVLFARAACEGLDPRRLVFAIEQAHFDPAGIADFASTMRRAEARLSVEVGIMSLVAGLCEREAVPDIVRLPEAWFHGLTMSPSTGRLLSKMTETLHRLGIQTHVQGISSPAQLALATSAGVDLLQGPLLGQCVPVGSAMDETPKPLSAILGEAGKVVTLASAARQKRA